MLRINLLIVSLLFSSVSQASIISRVGLDWLTWDETRNMSVEDALNTYQGDGWRLANFDEMLAFLNSFDFGRTFTKSDDEVNFFTPAYSTDDAINQVINLIGDTACGGRGCGPFDGASGGELWESTGAYFDEVLVNGSIRSARGIYLRDELFSVTFTYWTGVARFTSPRSIDTTNPNFGVALVRDSGSAVLPVTSVPAPATLMLMVLGMAGLVIRLNRHAGK